MKKPVKKILIYVLIGAASSAAIAMGIMTQEQVEAVKGVLLPLLGVL